MPCDFEVRSVQFAGHSKIEPHIGFCIVLRYAVPLRIHPAKEDLRIRITLVGGFAEPHSSLCKVFLHPLTRQIHAAEVELSLSKTLLCSLAIPNSSLRVIVRNTAP